jgi:hypothetical protein
MRREHRSSPRSSDSVPPVPRSPHTGYVRYRAAVPTVPLSLHSVHLSYQRSDPYGTMCTRRIDDTGIVSFRHTAERPKQAMKVGE